VSTYELLDELKRRHPGVEIESCAGGGGRIDLAVLERTDRIWASDNNDALDRQLAALGHFVDELDGREIKRFDGRTEVLHTRGAEVVEYRPSVRERLVQSIADPNIGYILMVVGALGIYAEFQAPGLIFPGVAGGISLLLGLSSLAVMPVNWVGVALLILAMALFVLEAKFTSHGILGTGGTVAMVLGSMLLINGPPEMRIHLGTAISGQAARALRDEAGVDSRTIASLVWRLEHGTLRLDERTVLLIDEAGMADDKAMLKLLDRDPTGDTAAAHGCEIHAALACERPPPDVA